MTDEISTLYMYPTACCDANITFDAGEGKSEARDFRCVKCNAVIANTDAEFLVYLTAHNLK